MESIIIEIIEKFGYFGICFLIAIENIFPPIPSEVILTFSGFATTFSNLNIIWVIFFSTLGSIIGAIILYYLGYILNSKKIDKFINSKLGKMLRLKKQNIQKADNWFNTKGSSTVLFCRFIPIVRSLISIPAGSAKMDFNIFLIFTLIGSLIWNTVLCILGVIAGNSWGNIVVFFDNYSKAALIILVIIFVVILYLFFRKKIK